MVKTRADRYCTVCGDHYLYCRCQEYDGMEPWHDAYCSDNCKNLYNITAGWLNNWLDKEVEIARLENCDISKIDKFPQWMQDVIKEMKEYNKKNDIPVDAINQVMGKNEVEEKPVKKINPKKVREESKKND